MTAQSTDFRALERENRGDTARLVMVFVVLFTALGFGFDFVLGNVRLLDSGGLGGFPFLTIAALIIATIQSLLRTTAARRSCCSRPTPRR